MLRVALAVNELEDRTTPAPLTVENLSDDVNTKNSLRWCIVQANSTAELDDITFDPSKCKGDTLKMTSGQYEVTQPLSINGSLGDNKMITITGILRANPQGTDRHFAVKGKGELALSKIASIGWPNGIGGPWTG